MCLCPYCVCAQAIALNYVYTVQTLRHIFYRFMLERSVLLTPSAGSGSEKHKIVALSDLIAHVLACYGNKSADDDIEDKPCGIESLTPGASSDEVSKALLTSLMRSDIASSESLEIPEAHNESPLQADEVCDNGEARWLHFQSGV